MGISGYRIDNQVEQAFAAAEATPAEASAGVDSCAVRHRFWQGAKKPARRGLLTWRPKKMYRASAKKWLRSVNNQLAVGTHTGGLKYFQYDPSKSVWSDCNWASWPYIMFLQDLGPDSTCGYFAGERKFDINGDLVGDWSHGGNRDVFLSLDEAELKGFFQVMVMHFNVPMGPSNDEGWLQVINDAVAFIRLHHKPKNTPLFLAIVADMRQQFEQQGMEMPPGEDPDDVLFEYALAAEESRRNGSRVTSCRFQASVASCQLNLQYWFADKFVRTAFKQNMYLLSVVVFVGVCVLYHFFSSSCTTLMDTILK